MLSLTQLRSFFLALLLALPAAAQDPGAQTLNPEFEALGKRWQGAMESLGVPGLALAVVEGDQLLHLQTFGMRNAETRQLVNPDTMFYIASATKPFVALALLQCVDEGSLDLDAPLKRYLPHFELADKQASETITTRDLLCHRPGIQSAEIVLLDAYSGSITDERYFHFLRQVEPSGRVSYTNVHLTLAGHVLQALDQRPWKQALAQRIFEPLGMQHTTGYATWMYAQDNVAMPMLLGAGGFEHAAQRKTDETMHAAGGLGTSIKDAASWLQLNLSRGKLKQKRLLSEAMLEEMFTLQSELDRGDDVDGFGLGWMHGQLHGETLLQHGGGYVGSAAHFSLMPEIGLGVALLANNGLGGGALVETVRRDVYAHMLAAEVGFDRLPGLIRSVQQQRQRQEAALATGTNPALGPLGLSLKPAHYAGRFRDTHFGDLELLWDGQQLTGRLGNLALSLHERGLDRFQVFADGLLEWELVVRIEAGRVQALESVAGERLLRFERVP